MSSAEVTPPAATSNDDAATTVSGITTATERGSQGRGGGGRGTGRGRGGRHNNRRNQNRSMSSNTSTATVKADKFVGKTQALSGHCFHIPAEKPKRNEFITTLEAIRLFASDKYKSQYRRLKITLFEEFKEPTVDEPDKPTDSTSSTYDLDVKIFMADYTEYLKEKKDLENTLESLFDVIYGQCSPLMRVKLNATQTFKKMRETSAVWDLLKQIKGITHQFQSNISPYEAIDEAKRQYYSYVHNNDHMDANTYVKTMKNIVDSIEFYGGTLGEDKVLIEYEKALDKKLGRQAKSDDEYKALTKNKMIAVGVLRRADKRYFGHVLRDLRNEFQLGRDTYPENHTRSLDLMQNYHPIEANQSSTPSRSQPRNDTANEGDSFAVTEDVQFTQVSSPSGCSVIVPGTNGKSYPKITCFTCNKIGHYADFCPTKRSSKEKPAAKTKPLAPQPSSVPISILKPATIIPTSSPKKPVASPAKTTPAANPQLAQLDDVASIDNIALVADAIPPDPPNYESDDTLEPDFVCTQTVDVTDPTLKDCILVDTGSSVNTFGTSRYVSNIRPAPRPLTTNSTGGLQQYTQNATFFGFMDVWFDADCLVNILSFFDLQQHFRITIDTAVDPGFYIHIRDGTTLKFLPYKKNIYLLDPVDYCKLNTALTSYSCANVVAQNKVNFTRRELEGAERARALYKRMQKPAYSVFLTRLSKNLVKDSKVTVEDAQRAYAIYGPDLDYSKGHDTRKQPPHLQYRKDIPIPWFILQYHSEIVVFMDFFFANAESYLHSISEGYKFRTGQATPNRTKATMLKCATTILQQYRSRGIKVIEIRADGEFSCIQDDVPCRIATAAPGTHVPEVERSIRYIKEGARTSQSSLPFKRRPRLLNRGNIYCQIINANDFPTGDGLSDTLSPATLITGRPSPTYDEIMKVGHGDYVHAYTETKNDMSPRAVGAIALYPAKNGQGGWYFLSLRSGKRILCNQWKNAVICDKVIDRVHALADAEVDKAKFEADDSMMFEWRPGQGSIEFPTENNYEVV